MRLARGAFVRIGAPVAAGAFATASAPVRAQAYTMRMSIAGGPASIFALVGQRFAAAVDRRSGGRLNIEIYPNGQLARERESIDGLAAGTVDFSVFSASFLEPLFPQYQIFDVPFLFKNLAAGYRVFDGPIGDELFAALEAKGIVGLGWATGGFKEIETTGKPVVVPDDLKGLRMRIQSGAVYVATYQALGAIPVVLDASETFVALTQHTVDGMDYVIDVVTTGKFYTVIKQIAMSNHILLVSPLLGSKKKIESLPADLQRIVREEGKSVVPFWRSANARQTAEQIQTLKKNGVAFTEIQFAAFRKAVEPVYATIQAKLGGDLLERVERAAGA